MRVSIALIAFTVFLAACGKKEAADESGAGSQMSANAISGNDVTAIDAVTGEAANMAADVDLNEDIANSLENAAQGEMTKSQTAKPAPATKKEPAPAANQPATTEAPATNATL